MPPSPSTHTRVSALLGTLACLFLSFYLDGLISLLIFALAGVLFVYIEAKADVTTFGHGIRGLKYHVALTSTRGYRSWAGEQSRLVSWRLCVEPCERVHVRVLLPRTNTTPSTQQTGLYGMEESLTANAILGDKVGRTCGERFDQSMPSIRARSHARQSPPASTLPTSPPSGASAVATAPPPPPARPKATLPPRPPPRPPRQKGPARLVGGWPLGAVAATGAPRFWCTCPPRKYNLLPAV